MVYHCDSKESYHYSSKHLLPLYHCVIKDFVIKDLYWEEDRPLVLTVKAKNSWLVLDSVCASTTLTTSVVLSYVWLLLVLGEKCRLQWLTTHHHQSSAPCLHRVFLTTLFQLPVETRVCYTLLSLFMLHDSIFTYLGYVQLLIWA